jgi:hypothetical protein
LIFFHKRAGSHEMIKDLCTLVELLHKAGGHVL